MNGYELRAYEITHRKPKPYAMDTDLKEYVAPPGQWDPFGDGHTKALRTPHNEVDPYLEILDLVKKIEKRVDGLEEKIKAVAAEKFKETPAGSSINKAFRG